MELIGLKVKHTVFGVGTITENDGNYITVEFAAKTTKFVYPDAFEKFIKAEEPSVQQAITDEINDANNHFVQLIINGEERGLNGMGSGLNPRTAIGQRADGALLLFVTDGRGKSGHLGASALDLITIMKEYGAVNAANLDGGSSSCMYYDNEYLMTSVTLYYSNSSWKLPAGFIVK